MKKLYISKNREKLINLPIGRIYYISLKWRHDRDRRDLHVLKNYGYFKQIYRFAFQRIKQ